MEDEIDDDQALKIARVREGNVEGDENEDTLFSPNLFVSEPDKPVTFHFTKKKRRQAMMNADDEQEILMINVYCVERELQHTVAAEGEIVWPAAEVLCWYLTSQGESLMGRRGLELGAGVGLASMVMASLGAKQVVATDFDERSLHLLQKNFDEFHSGSTQSIETQILVRQLAWGNALSEFLASTKLISNSSTQTEEGFDFIMGSDIIYYASALRPLMKTISALLSKASTLSSDSSSCSSTSSGSPSLSPSSNSPSPRVFPSLLNRPSFILANSLVRLGPNRDPFESLVAKYDFTITLVPLEDFVPVKSIPAHPTNLMVIQRQFS
jgi:hypothetical protein